MNEMNTENVCRTCVGKCFNMTDIKTGFIECSGVQVPIATVLQMFSIFDVRINK